MRLLVRLTSLILLLIACSRALHQRDPIACHRYDAKCVKYIDANGRDPVPTPHGTKGSATLRQGVRIVKPVVAELYGGHVALLPDKASGKCKYLAQQGSTDGIGPQVHRKLSVLAFARANDYIYVHEPFHKIEDFSTDSEALQTTEAFFDIGRGEVTWEEVPANTTVCTTLQCNQNGYWSMLRPEILYRYWSSTVPRPDPISVNKRSAGLMVAMHMRRHDVPEEHPRPANYYVEVLDALTQALPPDLTAALHIVVYSDGGGDSDLADLMKERYPQAVLRRGVPPVPLARFHELVTSDVLIVGHSALSWAAGLYSNGVVLYGQSTLDYVPGWVDVRGDEGGRKVREYCGRNGTHSFLRSRLQLKSFM